MSRPISSNRMIAAPSSQYTTMASRVVHSNTLPSTRVIRNTLTNGATSGSVATLTHRVNHAAGLATNSRSANRSRSSASIASTMYQRISLPRDNVFVRMEVYEFIHTFHYEL